MTDEPIFEIGLVMAGAVSAGAYSAGVIDFLIEALDAYETSRTTGRTPEGEVWSGPTHAIRVPIITGASAGGMTAAITALQVHTNFEHVASGVAQSGPPKNNRLYASWVDEIGIEALLETSDLTGGNKLRSVLCSAVLDEIVGRTLKLPADRTRAWIGRDHALTVLFTISNTGGVPYRFSLEGAAHDSDYRMLNHGDDLRFVVGRSPPERSEFAGFDVVDLDKNDPAARGRFGTAALATGAFPIGLAARPISRPYADYDRDDRVGSDIIQPDGSLVFKPSRPVASGRADPHRFVAVDGGVIDNEPLELARRFLSGEATPNPSNRNGRETRYAVVLVDPFPNRQSWPEENSADLLSEVTPTLISMLVDQARFKPQELALALNESVFSRFVILPEPVDRSAAALALPIASGALGGFSGFLHRSFRHHDYCLGRRNAQAFLRWHFCLPEANPLFSEWKNRGGEAVNWYVREPPTSKVAANQITLVREQVASNDEPAPPNSRALPIIPLTPRLQREIVLGPNDRPRPDLVRRDLAHLENLLSNRFDAVVGRLIEDDLAALIPGGWFGKKALQLFLPGVLRRKAMNVVTAAVDQISAAFS